MNDRFATQQEMLEHALEQQVVLSRIALELNSLEKFDCRLNKCLKQIGQHTDVSRVYIFENNEDGTTVSNTFEWCNKGINPEIHNLKDIPYEAIPTWINSLKNEGRIYSENISELAQEVRDILEPQGVISIVVYPLFIKGAFYGFIGFDECNKVRKWSRSELEMLRAVSGIISHAYERRAMEQELIRERDRANRANRAKSEFLANMGHEIRTPMNAILGFSEALYNRLSAPESRQMLSSVMSAGHQLLALLNDLLDLSRIEAGRLELVTGPVNPSSMLYDLHSSYREKAAKKGLTLEVDVPRDLPASLVLDETRLRQVIGNLIGNAIKFTQQGKVTIRGAFELKTPGSGALVIEVEDTGIGIEKKMQDAIFEDFLQLNPKADRKYEGTGLGLSISKRLVEKMNGRIEVDSSPGKGSCFRIILPEAKFPAKDEPVNRPGLSPQPQPWVHPQHPEKYSHNEFEHASTLVADDDRSNIGMVGDLPEALRRELPEIARTLREIFIPQWEQIKDHLVIFRIEAFARQLKEFADEKGFPLLQAYADKLILETERFDIEGLKESLADFPGLIKKTENI